MASLKGLVSDFLSSMKKSAAVPCSDGALLVLTGRPALGVRYLDATGEATPFARTRGRGCVAEFSLLCVDSVLAVQAEPVGDCKTPPAGAGALRAEGWDICAAEAGVDELHVTQRLLHQTWDTEIGEMAVVEGCVGLRSAKSWP